MHALPARPLDNGWRGRGEVCAWTKSGHFASLLQWGIDRFAKQTRLASPRRGIVNLARALTEVTISLLQWGIDRFAEQTRSALPRRGGGLLPPYRIIKKKFLYDSFVL